MGIFSIFFLSEVSVFSYLTIEIHPIKYNSIPHTVILLKEKKQNSILLCIKNMQSIYIWCNRGQQKYAGLTNEDTKNI